jgi:hypothetical protein
MEFRIEMTGRRGRRRKQLLDDLKEKRSITQSEGGEEYRTYNKKKKG